MLQISVGMKDEMLPIFLEEIWNARLDLLSWRWSETETETLSIFPEK